MYLRNEILGVLLLFTFIRVDVPQCGTVRIERNIDKVWKEPFNLRSYTGEKNLSRDYVKLEKHLRSVYIE